MSSINSKQFRIMAATTALVFVIAGAGMAMAQGPGPGKGMRGERGDRGPRMGQERMMAHLDLTEEQAEAIKGLHEKNQGKSLELRKELMRLKNEMKGELLKDEPSEKTVLSLNDKIGEVKTELKANRLKTRLAVREQLTPEQRDKMLVMGKGHSQRGERFGDGPGRKFPGRAPRGGHGCGLGDGTGPRSGDCPKSDTKDQSDTNEQ